MLEPHTSILHAREGGDQGIRQNQQMRCDTGATVSYIAPRAGKIVSRPRWSSRFGELCATVKPRTQSPGIGAPFYAEKTSDFTLRNCFFDVLRGQGKFECLKGAVSAFATKLGDSDIPPDIA